MYKSPQEIKKWIYMCKHRFTLYSKLNPVLTDISWKHKLPEKINMVHDILKREKPTNIEISSFFMDSLDSSSPSSDKILEKEYVPFYHLLERKYGFFNEGHSGFQIRNRRKFYLGISHYNSLECAIKNKMDCFSFDTSISNSYLLKTMGRTILENKMELNRVHDYLKRIPKYDSLSRKLSISCLTECPYNGGIDPIYVVREILNYNRYDFTEICLCDTTGTIMYDDFEYILQYCVFFGIHPSKISLQFHVCIENLENVQKMIKYALSIGVHKFDVSGLSEYSELNVGNQKLNYLSYDLFYNTLMDYINKKCV